MSRRGRRIERRRFLQAAAAGIAAGGALGVPARAGALGLTRSVDGLPPDASVEVPCLVDRMGPHPIRMVRIVESIRRISFENRGLVRAN